MPKLSLLTWLDLNHIMRLMDTMGKEIPANAPWDAPNALEWDRITFKQFLDDNLTQQGAKEFMRVFITTCVTIEAHEASLLWFLWYVKQCGGTAVSFKNNKSIDVF